MTDQPCLEVPFDEVKKWEKIEGSCARLYAAAEWGYKQALATPPPEPPTDEELQEWVNATLGAEVGDPQEFGWGRHCFTKKQFARAIRAALEKWERLATPPLGAPTDEELWAIWNNHDGPIPAILRVALERWGHR